VSIEDDVRSALNRGELFIEYLPTLSLTDVRCVGAEALTRWRRPRAVLPAGAFMPQIENTPLSGTLTYWVIDTVAAELSDWLRVHADAHISINVPPEILGRGGLEYAAIHSGLIARAEQIILEITERGVPDRLGLDALNKMSSRGVRLALDDTMMSGANLALLTRCNFGMIKLDRELTAQLKEDGPPPDWIGGLESLLKTSSLQVIAEGVETEYQADRLHQVGVQFAQGHLFSTALSAQQFMEFYSEDHRL
jgi:EAL domain-containing protein (putative c-di-GMP-specific phosphodiesterase class I)